MLQYTQDYDEKFPISVVSTVNPPPEGVPVGWADAIQTYLKSVQIYQCPSESSPLNANPISSGYTDYWMNKNAGDGDQSCPQPTIPR